MIHNVSVSSTFAGIALFTLFAKLHHGLLPFLGFSMMPVMRNPVYTSLLIHRLPHGLNPDLLDLVQFGKKVEPEFQGLVFDPS
jgi:hypothetical protein